VEKFALIPRSEFSSHMNLEVNVVPQSLMMVSGRPWCLHTLSWNRQATLAESTVVVVGIA
jgi:hypothetical protein